MKVSAFAHGETPPPAPPVTTDDEPYHGDWIQTYTGRKFYPLDPRPGDVCIEDIAHALSMTCRFGGHCLKFYSVAEHSVHVARNVSRENALWGLLHDASEAYLVDVPRPLKHQLAGYRVAERRVEIAVARAISLPETMPDEVKRADHRILTDEMCQVMAPPPEPWAGMIEPLGVRIMGWAPDRAKAEFLAAYREYYCS